jgi:hypothetical protein
MTKNKAYAVRIAGETFDIVEARPGRGHGAVDSYLIRRENTGPAGTRKFQTILAVGGKCIDAGAELVTR